eukprot:TRINITY_DN6824_c0_g1_i4.p1 TRINITY_DN6824_c0_g1~~TRINITY_DN6824_c0_g1_i4.p1  ORF type:complete len:1017 (-),score=268.19 TRINITY_DN6824_c0_g1_i4:56-3106(-)
MARGCLITGILASVLCSVALAEESWDVPRESAVDLGGPDLEKLDSQSVNYQADDKDDPQGVMSASQEELPPTDDSEKTISVSDDGKFGSVPPKMPARKATEHDVQQTDSSDDDAEDDDDLQKEQQDVSTSNSTQDVHLQNQGRAEQKQHATQIEARKHEAQKPGLDSKNNDVAEDPVEQQGGGSDADPQEENEAPEHAAQVQVQTDQQPNQAPASQSDIAAHDSKQRQDPDAADDDDDDAADDGDDDESEERAAAPQPAQGESQKHQLPKLAPDSHTSNVTQATVQPHREVSDADSAGQDEADLDPSPDTGRKEDASQSDVPVHQKPTADEFKESDGSTGDKFLEASVGNATHATDAKATQTTNATDVKGVPFLFRQKVVGSTPTGSISMGTPPVEMGMILDTGSDKLVVKTWLTLMTSIERIDADAANLVNPSSKIYSHNASTTYRALFSNSSSGKQVPKQGFIAYGSGMAYTAEGEDTVGLDQANITNFPVSEISMDSLQVLHSTKGVSGILGLQHMKNRSLGDSFFSKMRDQGTMTAFGYCRGDNDDGTFLWGDTSKEGEQLEVVGVMHWAVPISSVKKHEPKDASANSSKKQQDVSSVLDIAKHNGSLTVLQSEGGGDDSNGYISGVLDPLDKLKEIIQKLRHQHHGNRDSDPDPDSGFDDDWARVEEAQEEPKKVEFKEACEHQGSCVAVIDTGSNIIAMPSRVLAPLRESLNVSRDCSNLAELPELHFKLGGNFLVRLPAEAYVMKVKIPGLPGVENDNEASSRSSSEEYSAKSSDDKDLEHVSRLEDTKPKVVIKRKRGGGLSDFWEVDVGLGSAQPDYGGLVQQDSTASSRYRARVAKLESMLQETLDNHGVDLRSMFPGQGIGEMLKLFSKPTTLCMPALVSMDRNTTKGDLWVVGTPLFEKYYTRWSWAKGDASPQIFLKEKSKAEVCKGEKSEDTSKSSEEEEEEADKMTVIRDQSQKPVMRSENPAQQKRNGKAEALHEVSIEPKEVDLKDIRYPHWAKTFEFL